MGGFGFEGLEFFGSDHGREEKSEAGTDEDRDECDDEECDVALGCACCLGECENWGCMVHDRLRAGFELLAFIAWGESSLKFGGRARLGVGLVGVG